MVYVTTNPNIFNILSVDVFIVDLFWCVSFLLFVVVFTRKPKRIWSITCKYYIIYSLIRRWPGIFHPTETLMLHPVCNRFTQPHVAKFGLISKKTELVLKIISDKLVSVAFIWFPTYIDSSQRSASDILCFINDTNRLSDM